MNLTTIIPVHEYNEEVEKLFNAAIDTVIEQDGIDEKPEVLVVYVAELDNNELFNKNKEKTYENITLTYLKNEGNTDFQSQINFGVENTKTDWFSILEFDDELSTTYYKNVLHHIEKLDNVDLILPILVEVNENNDALKLTNETVWSKQFVGENGEMGYLNVVALNQYTDFKISGGVFKKSEFESVGGLKSNIKLTFTYELLLRMLNNGSNIYTMPKIGVKHFTTREGSLFDDYNKTLTIQDRKFWFDTAKKESNFFNDRVIDMSLLTKTE
jgi:hypothetical protein